MVSYELEQKRYRTLFLDLGMILSFMKGYSDISIIKNLDDEQEYEEWFSAYFDNKIGERLFRFDKQYEPQKDLEEAYIRHFFFSRARPGTTNYSMQLLVIFKEAKQKIFDENVSNDKFKKELVQKLLEKNLELSQISPDIMQNIIFELPILRQLILARMIDMVIEINQKIVEELPSRLRKIILFRLIYILLGDEKINEFQKDSLSVICKKMDIDNEYINEFTVLAHKLDSVSTEINELINE